MAIFGQTNINWVVSLFALSKLGYTVLSLSPRLSSAAIVKLLQETQCECLVHGNEPPLLRLIRESTAAIGIQGVPMLSRAEYDDVERSSRPLPENSDQEARPAVIMHSSGSTGLPKSLTIPHRRLVEEYPLPGQDRDLVTLPLFVFQQFLDQDLADQNLQVPHICTDYVTDANVSAPNSAFPKSRPSDNM